MRDGALRGETIAVADPGDLLTVAAAFPDVPLFYWEEPACGVAIVGLGAARELRAGGVARFAAISAAATDLLASIAATGAALDGGRVVGGFGFADADTSADEWREFPAARLVLPRLLWARDAGGTRLTVTESGFDGVPLARRAESFRMNSEGWAEQVRNIEAYVTAAP